MREHYLNNPAYIALWDKAIEGFKLVSGTGWETRANYQHFWPLCQQLYSFVYGEKAVMPNELKARLAFMFAGHAGRIRKGLRQRPYFHHVLMVVYLAWITRQPLAVQLAAISHDDREDVPKNLKVSEGWVDNIFLALVNSPDDQVANRIVIGLTNEKNWPDKHQGQRAKMAKVDQSTGQLKLLDRIANLYDMRQDKPKGFTPARIQQECQQAWELADAMPTQADEAVLALLAFMTNLLGRENG